MHTQVIQSVAAWAERYKEEVMQAVQVREYLGNMFAACLSSNQLV